MAHGAWHGGLHLQAATCQPGPGTVHPGLGVAEPLGMLTLATEKAARSFAPAAFEAAFAWNCSQQREGRDVFTLCTRPFGVSLILPPLNPIHEALICACTVAVSDVHIPTYSTASFLAYLD